MMNSNLIKIATLLTFAQCADVEFGKRPDDRKRNKNLPELGEVEEEWTDDIMYLPGKWPYNKDENLEKEQEEVIPVEEEEDLAVISSSFAPKWTHDVIIPFDTKDFNDSQKIFMKRLGDAVWQHTCVHFVPTEENDVEEDKQFVRFVMEEPGCDEIIGMKDITYERPQMQGMHTDCVKEMTPQFTSHYLMHILGFDNEHQRPDSKDFIKINNKDQIAVNEVPQRFGRNGHDYLLKKKDNVSYANGLFDPASLMMWSSFYVGEIKDKDGKVIENAHMGSDVGQVFLEAKGDDGLENKDIKNHDISKINKYYECKPMPKLPPAKKTTPPPTEDEPEKPKTTTPPQEIDEPETTTPPQEKPKTTTPPQQEPTPKELDCVYHIKEDGDKKKVVDPECFKKEAKINIWPGEDKEVHVVFKWNIDESGDGELTDMPNPGRRMLGYAEDLKDFQDNHTKEVDDALEHNCERAKIMNAENGDINLATSVVCGQGEKSLKSKCGKGIKHDYIKLKPGWVSKTFNAYMIAEAVYVDCPKRTRGIALNGDKSENNDGDNEGSEFSSTKTSNVVLSMLALLA